MDQTEEEGGGEGGKALYSWQVTRLVVGAGSSLSHSTGRGSGTRAMRLAAQLPQGTGVKNTLLFFFLPCKHCMISQLSVLLAVRDKTKQDIKTFFITLCFPRSD